MLEKVMRFLLRSEAYWKVIIAAFPLFAFVTFSKAVEPPHDFWMHAASVRAVSEDPLHPSDPYLQLAGSNNPWFVPYTVFLGFVDRLSGINLFTLMWLAAMANYLLFATGLYLFIRELFSDRQMPLYVLLACWLFWGVGWGHSGNYKLEVFLVTLSYPFMFSYAIGFFALYLFLVFLRSSKLWALGCSSLLAAVGFLNHMPTGALCLLFQFAILVTAGDGKRVRRGVLGLVLTAAAILIAASIWPYFSYYKTFREGVAGNWYRPSMYSGIVSGLGPALLGLPILILLRVKRHHQFVLVGFFMTTSVYVAGYVIGIEVAERFILLTAFFLHLAIAAYLREKQALSFHKVRQWFANVRSSKSSTQVEQELLVAAIISFLFLLSLGLRANALSFHAKRVVDLRPKLAIHRYENSVDKYLILKGYINSSDVVLSDVKTSWMIPAITGAKVVAAFHENPLLAVENKRRAAAITAFFDPTTSFTQRQAIVREYRVSRVVVNSEFVKIAKVDATSIMHGVGDLMAEVHDMLLYRVGQERDSTKLSLDSME